jgi:hypothetical protein
VPPNQASDYEDNPFATAFPRSAGARYLTNGDIFDGRVEEIAAFSLGGKLGLTPIYTTEV